MGNLIAGICVGFRDPAQRLPMATRQNASSKTHAILACETLRISTPSCFLDQGEGIASGGEAHHGTNDWVYCASSIRPEKGDEGAAWRKAMPVGCGAASPIHWRSFARTLGAIAAK